MKNIVCLKSLQPCQACKLKGFFSYSKNKGDFITCPSCGQGEYFWGGVCDEKFVEDLDLIIYNNQDEKDMHFKYSYCNHCKIIFKKGCMHAENILNAHFIKKWKNKKTGEKHEGMPLFDDNQDWFDNVNDVEIIEEWCPHKGNKCIRTNYVLSKGCDL